MLSFVQHLHPIPPALEHQNSYFALISALFPGRINYNGLTMGFNKTHKMAQRLHRERRQPENRRKLGYLEKKQDYKKRALDHQIKAKQVKKLKQKAQARNPNEFHFHMINSRIVDGVHQEIVKPVDDAKERKKNELVKRYNQRIMQKRLKRESETVSIEI